MELIECVPNISSGDAAVVSKVCKSLSALPIFLLHTDSNPDANRTVLTFTGEPLAVLEAAFTLIRYSLELIDMSTHSGVHPCVGATDVCPFIPLEGSSLEKCQALAHTLAKRVATELNLPVFLYAKAASSSERYPLSYFRQGGLSRLKERLENLELFPDYGPPQLHPTGGAVLIGARDFLIAYNVNLKNASLAQAKRLASWIRESGSHTNTAPVQPLRAVQAIGWELKGVGITQVSTNILDFRTTSLFTVFNTIGEAAQDLGIEVTGSELIGLVPKEALIRSGQEAANQSGIKISTEAELLAYASKALGLSDLAPFVTTERIIEKRLAAFGVYL